MKKARVPRHRGSRGVPSRKSRPEIAIVKFAQVASGGEDRGSDAESNRGKEASTARHGRKQRSVRRKVKRRRWAKYPLVGRDWHLPHGVPHCARFASSGLPEW